MKRETLAATTDRKSLDMSMNNILDNSWAWVNQRIHSHCDQHILTLSFHNPTVDILNYPL